MVGRSFTVMACLALTAALTSAVKADPVIGTVTLAVARETDTGGDLGGIAQGPVVYSSGSVDLSQVFQSEVQPGGAILEGNSVNLTGPHLLNTFGGLGESFDTNLQLKIAFDGASGSQPTINVTGVMSVTAEGTPEGTFNTGAHISAYGTPQSATLQGWNLDSGIPISLINQ